MIFRKNQQKEMKKIKKYESKTNFEKYFLLNMKYYF